MSLNKIQELEDMMHGIRARLDHVESVLNIESPFPSDTAWESDMTEMDEAAMGGVDMEHMDELLTAGDVAQPDYAGSTDDTTLGANDIEHTHEDGTTHSHKGGDVAHEHGDPAHIDTTELDHSNAAAYDTLPSDVEPSPEGK